VTAEARWPCHALVNWAARQQTVQETTSRGRRQFGAKANVVSAAALSVVLKPKTSTLWTCRVRHSSPRQH